MIDHVAALLMKAGAKATWFVTHDSPATRRLTDAQDLFELGIHPNFAVGSTHGDTPSDVLESCLNLAPCATVMRTHGLLQSTSLLNLAVSYGVRTDSSIFLPHATKIEPVEYWWSGRKLTRIPYVWEDDFEMHRPTPVWSISALRPTVGPRIFDFHPVHVWLNAATDEPYRQLKERSKSLNEVTLAQSKDLQCRGSGPGSMFRELLDAIAKQGSSRTLSEISDSQNEAVQ